MPAPRAAPPRAATSPTELPRWDASSRLLGSGCRSAPGCPLTGRVVFWPRAGVAAPRHCVPSAAPSLPPKWRRQDGSEATFRGPAPGGAAARSGQVWQAAPPRARCGRPRSRRRRPRQCPQAPAVIPQPRQAVAPTFLDFVLGALMF